MSDSLDSKAQSSNESANKGWFNRFLAGVEFLGNMLPHPITFTCNILYRNCCI